MPTRGPQYDDDRIGRLESATERLSQNVVGLATALALVSEINQRQLELEERASITEIKAEAVAVTTAQVAQEAVDFRKAALTRIYTISIVAVLVVVALVAGLQARAVQQRHSRQVLCESSAFTAGTVRQFANEQIAIEQSNTHIDDILRAKRIKSLTSLLKAFPVPPCLKELHS